MFFFFNDTATTEIYTLSLHDALPICRVPAQAPRVLHALVDNLLRRPVDCFAHSLDLAEPLTKLPARLRRHARRSEEHTSELQSRQYLVCRLLLEKKITCNCNATARLN